MSLARLIWAAQVAAVDRWKAHAPLAAIIAGRIYDGEVPDDEQGAHPVMPYVVLDTLTGAPRGALAARGAEATFSGSVWSAMPSNSEAMQVLGLMDDALQEKLALDGFNPARLKMEFATTVVAGRNLRQAPFRCRIISLEAA
jgi:hypothetical protein